MANHKQGDYFIHPTAIIEEGVYIGKRSKIWDHVHIRKNAWIGDDTSIGGKSCIAYDVIVGNYVKINAMVYVCSGVAIEDMCMISAGTVFTNDLFPRAMNRDLTALETSYPTTETLSTRVKRGTTVGANVTIGPGVSLGCFSMVGMGAIVTEDVPPHGLVVGNPARLIGYVCICGSRLLRSDLPFPVDSSFICDTCHRQYLWDGKELELEKKTVYGKK